jgi:hypothetical protein
MKKAFRLPALAIAIMALFFTTDLKAQTNPANVWMISIGADAGLPTGNLTIGSNFVLGGTARLQYGISNSLAATLTSGADHFFSKEIPGTNVRYNSFGVIPIKAGLKQFFTPSFYLGLEAGVAFEQVDSGHANTKFLVSPAVGWGSKHWDVGIRYDNYSGQNDPYGFVAIRIAYGFAL